MTSTKKIFAFWESNEPIPGYLELCKRTWIKNIPNAEIHIINYKNLNQYIGETYNIDLLKKIPLAMQSDIISAAVLEKFGGLFLDLDCIVTDDVFEILSAISDTKLISFGYPPNRGIHLAVLYCAVPNNPMLTYWRKIAQERLSNLPEKYDWDFFGNSIINSMLKNEIYKNDYMIIDRTESGNILESAAMLESTHNNAKEYYKNFYFNPYFNLQNNVIDLVKCGIISLHNSWTPPHLKKIKDPEIFLQKDLPISYLLKFILNNDTHSKGYQIILLEKNFVTKLEQQNIYCKRKFFKGMLVLDFSKYDINFGFDLSILESQITLDIIARDSYSLNSLKNIKSLDFKDNKAKVITSSEQDIVLNKIISIYNGINP